MVQTPLYTTAIPAITAFVQRILLKPLAAGRVQVMWEEAGCQKAWKSERVLRDSLAGFPFELHSALRRNACAVMPAGSSWAVPCRS